jgi:hypothetical protein
MGRLHKASFLTFVDAFFTILLEWRGCLCLILTIAFALVIFHFISSDWGRLLLAGPVIILGIGIGLVWQHRANRRLVRRITGHDGS